MKLTNCSIRQFAVLASLLALAGCQTPPARVELQRVNVPLPVSVPVPAASRCLSALPCPPTSCAVAPR